MGRKLEYGELSGELDRLEQFLLPSATDRQNPSTPRRGLFAPLPLSRYSRASMEA
jgi:hypothetical protein